jgi:predicted glycogen debranching enzyme
MHERSGLASLVAGYPWFGAYARDTLIALPGLHLATEDWDTTSALLDALVTGRKGGLIAATFAPDDHSGGSLDASLLFVRAIHWLSAHEGQAAVERYMPIACELLEALADRDDPRFRLLPGEGVRMQPGPWALTWMDARIDGHPVTPRHGHAVDVDALLHHALSFTLQWAEKHDALRAKRMAPLLAGLGRRFVARFWDDTRGYLADAELDGRVDDRLRPNQLWAAALAHSPLTPVMKASVIEVVQRSLWTPAGLRSLAPGQPGYVGRCTGHPHDRDRAYHQGSAWPWLLAIFADAIVAVEGRAALERVLAPSLSFLARHVAEEGCIGQVNEVFDGDAPQVPGGAPAQATSTCELYRVWRMLHGGS